MKNVQHRGRRKEEKITSRNSHSALVCIYPRNQVSVQWFHSCYAGFPTEKFTAISARKWGLSNAISFAVFYIGRSLIFGLSTSMKTLNCDFMVSSLEQLHWSLSSSKSISLHFMGQLNTLQNITRSFNINNRFFFPKIWCSYCQSHISCPVWELEF